MSSLFILSRSRLMANMVTAATTHTQTIPHHSSSTPARATKIATYSACRTKRNSVRGVIDRRLSQPLEPDTVVLGTLPLLGGPARQNRDLHRLTQDRPLALDPLHGRPASSGSPEVVGRCRRD